MKKFLTIGRDAQCDICINDSTDVVSRNHAILEIGGNGKYFIVDQSRNGTYVNGMRISSNEKVPVTRNDVISLAHVRELDWSLVPKNNDRLLWIGVASAVVAVLVAAAFLLYPGRAADNKDDDNLNLFGSGSSVEQSGGGAIVASPDTGDKADEADNGDSATEENAPDDKKVDSKVEKPKPAKNKKTDNAGKDDAIVDPIY